MEEKTKLFFLEKNINYKQSFLDIYTLIGKFLGCNPSRVSAAKCIQREF